MLPSESSTLEITVTAFASLLKDEDTEQPFVIDCREKDEHDLCRLEMAQLIPLSSFGASVEGKLPEKEEAIVVYCHHGMRSLKATEFLRRKGYVKTFSLEGGIDAWAVTQDPSMVRY